MDSILEAMLARVPDDYDKSEGSIFYDALAPVAKELAALVEMANAILDSRFLDTAVGTELDRVVGEFGVTRKAAQLAEGEVTFYGSAGTPISAGALVASEAVQYYVRVDCTIGTDGTVTVPVVCAVSGTVGNVGAGYVNRLPVTLAGVDSVSNAEPMTGGYDEETDDELRERTYIKIRTPGTSGNRHDYVNWAMSVEGVGGAKVTPLWDGNGTVKVVIVDSNGETAQDELVTAVAEYIETVRPVGASVTVMSATAKIIDVSAAVAVKAGYDSVLVGDAISAAIKAYLQTFGLSGSEVSAAKIGAVILGVDGVDDYSGLTVNGGTVNIALDADEVPMMGVFTNVA